MSKQGRKQVKPPGENAALKRRIERMEAIASALVADVEVLKQRLAKVETAQGLVAKGEMPPNVEREDTRTGETDEQRPETE